MSRAQGLVPFLTALVAIIRTAPGIVAPTIVARASSIPGIVAAIPGIVATVPFVAAEIPVVTGHSIYQ